MAKEVRYREPDGYFPKEIRDKYFGKNAGKTAKKTTSKPKTAKKGK